MQLDHPGGTALGMCTASRCWRPGRQPSVSTGNTGDGPFPADSYTVETPADNRLRVDLPLDSCAASPCLPDQRL